jgi:hypothetical protein
MIADVELMRAPDKKPNEVAPMVRAPTWPLGATLPRRHSVIPAINMDTRKPDRSPGRPRVQRSASVVAEPRSTQDTKKDKNMSKELSSGKGFAKVLVCD